MRLDRPAARRVHLAAQGLSALPTKQATKRDVLGAIRRMGALQIDTISVVARSPYFVLWSRIGKYEQRWLNELLTEGKVFEYWSHAASFLPIEDYTLYRAIMQAGFKNWRLWRNDHPEVVEFVRAFLEEQGEAQSSDFESTGDRPGRFWAWKREKLALECLFRTGEVMTVRRDPGFQRIYGLPERVLRGREFPEMALEEARRELVVKAVRCLGIARASWVPDYFRLRTAGVTRMLQEELETGTLFAVEVEGWKDPVYVHRDNLKLVKAAARGTVPASVTTLFTPFDPVVWHRKRALELFDFTYLIEVYTPPEKRKYGYYNLPILHRDALVGRLDAKAHRQEGVFEVREMHLEDGLRPEDELVVELSATLTRCADWHRTAGIRVSARGVLAAAVQDELRRADRLV
jgi:uncharacterized protein YcaQ